MIGKGAATERLPRLHAIRMFLAVATCVVGTATIVKLGLGGSISSEILLRFAAGLILFLVGALNLAAATGRSPAFMVHAGNCTAVVFASLFLAENPSGTAYVGVACVVLLALAAFGGGWAGHTRE